MSDSVSGSEEWSTKKNERSDIKSDSDKWSDSDNDSDKWSDSDSDKWSDSDSRSDIKSDSDKWSDSDSRSDIKSDSDKWSDSDIKSNTEREIVLVLHVTLKRNKEHMTIPCRVKYINEEQADLSRNINFEDIIAYIQTWCEDKYEDWVVDESRDIIEVKNYVATKKGKVDIIFEY